MATYFDLISSVTELLEEHGRVSYRAIQRELEIGDDVLADVKMELIEVKGIARDVGGSMIELVGATQPAPKQPTTKSVPVPMAADLPSKASPVTPTSGVPSAAPTSPPVRRSAMIWVGAAMVAVGVVMPWAKAYIRIGDLGSQVQTATGLDVNQGLLSLGVSITGAILGFLAARPTVSARFVAFVVFVTGGVVLASTMQALDGIGRSAFNVGGVNLMSIRIKEQPGIFVSMAGGGLLALGGLIAFARAGRRRTAA